MKTNINNTIYKKCLIACKLKEQDITNFINKLLSDAIDKELINFEFFKKCERDIQNKKERLKKLKSIPKNQIDLEDIIKEMEDQ